MSVTGHCNQCGLCCYVGAYKCEHLDVGGIPGMPAATRCDAYDKRYTDMPILLVDPQGAVKQGFCLHNSDAEDASLTKLIQVGRCSMEVSDG